MKNEEWVLDLRGDKDKEEESEQAPKNTEWVAELIDENGEVMKPVCEKCSSSEALIHMCGEEGMKSYCQTCLYGPSKDDRSTWSSNLKFIEPKKSPSMAINPRIDEDDWNTHPLGMCDENKDK